MTTLPNQPTHPHDDRTRRRMFVVSLGCPKNRVDTEIMLGVTQQQGFDITDSPEDADVILVNTCGFIDEAKQESVEAILEMAEFKKGRCEQLVVAGCLPQRYGQELAVELPEVDHFLGSSDMLKLKTILKKQAPRMFVGNPADYIMSAQHPRLLSTLQHTAYLKIAEGCSRKCSFCSIPSFRGTQRSRAIEDIVAEAEMLVAQGVIEINLISQDTVRYGQDLPDKKRLPDLVQALSEVKGLRWLRLFYLYPGPLSDELAELMQDHPVVLPYIDMPLQHASDSMLRRMKRGHGGDRIRKTVEIIRNKVPSATFRTAFIVGHPGESDADFDELMEFVAWGKFDSVGTFVYSQEDNTASGAMSQQVPREVALQRRDELMKLQQGISHDKQRSFIGKTIEVLVEGISDESEFLLQGRHKGQAPDIDGKVYLANGEAKAGEIRLAKVTQAAEYDLLADLRKPQGQKHLPTW